MYFGSLRNLKLQEGGDPLWERQLGVESGSYKVAAERLDVGELQGLHAQIERCVDVDLFVVEKERFVGASAELLERVEIDLGVGLGHAKLIAPYEDVEAGDPFEFLLDAFEYGVAHVGEDRGSQAVLLEAQLPGDRRRVLGSPHARVEAVEFFNGRWAEIEFGVAEKFLPEADAGELAFVVGVAVVPIEALEAINRQAGDAYHCVVRFGVRWSGQHHSVVKDHRAQSQSASPNARVC
jgi:hypothetical protein